MTATLVCTACGQDVPVTGATVTCSCGEIYRGLGDLAGSTATPQEEGKSGEEKAIDFWRGLGAAVYKLSQPSRARGMTRGVPDLLIFGRGSRLAPPVAFHEVKSGSGRLTRHQERFRELCQEAGVPHVVGDAKAAAEFLGLEVR